MNEQGGTPSSDLILPAVGSEVLALPARQEIYRDPQYVTLYRYENPTISCDPTREGIVSKQHLIGAWFCDSLKDLTTYAIRRIQGKPGGRFVAVRVKRDELDRYDAKRNPETMGMDIEAGNYIIPVDVREQTAIFVDALFNSEWTGKANVPFKDWGLIQHFVETNLSDEALQKIA